MAWGMTFDPGTNLVDVYVGYLRRKLGETVIETVRGAGYRLRADSPASIPHEPGPDSNPAPATCSGASARRDNYRRITGHNEHLFVRLFALWRRGSL